MTKYVFYAPNGLIGDSKMIAGGILSIPVGAGIARIAAPAREVHPGLFWVEMPVFISPEKAIGALGVDEILHMEHGMVFHHTEKFSTTGGRLNGVSTPGGPVTKSFFQTMIGDYPTMEGLRPHPLYSVTPQLGFVDVTGIQGFLRADRIIRGIRKTHEYQKMRELYQVFPYNVDLPAKIRAYGLENHNFSDLHIVRVVAAIDEFHDTHKLTFFALPAANKVVNNILCNLNRINLRGI